MTAAPSNDSAPAIAARAGAAPPPTEFEATGPDEPPMTARSLKQMTLTGAMWLVAWRMLTRSIGLVSTLVLARLLLTSDFGLIAMATGFAASVEALSQLGLQDALVRRRTEGMELHDSAFTLQLGRAVLTGAIIAGCAPAAAWWFSEPRLTPVLLVLAGTTILGGFENVGIAEYRREMRFDVQFRMMLTRRIVGFLVTTTVAFIFHSYVALLAGMVAGTLVWVVMGYVMHPFRPRLGLRHWRELAHFSYWTWAATLASLVWDRCDAFVLGPVFGSAGLGLYLLAFEIATLPITELISPAADALFSGFARSQKEGTSTLPVALDASCMILILVAPMVLLISAASGPIIEVLLGAKWSSAWGVAAILSWLCLFSPVSYVVSSALVANGFVRQNFWARCTNSVLKLAVLVGVVACTNEMWAVAVAMVGIVAAEAVVYLSFLSSKIDISLRAFWGALARVALSLAVAVAAVAGSDLGWHPGSGELVSNLVRGIQVGLVTAAAFPAALFVAWVVSGRPTGPETQLANLVRERLAPLAYRLKRG